MWNPRILACPLQWHIAVQTTVLGLSVIYLTFHIKNRDKFALKALLASWLLRILQAHSVQNKQDLEVFFYLPPKKKMCKYMTWGEAQYPDSDF